MSPRAGGALGLFSKGRERSFTDVFSRYYDIFFREFYRKTGCYQSAEDLAQELFTRLYADFDMVEKPGPWLYGACRNLIAEYYRTRFRVQDTLAGDVPSQDCERDWSPVLNEVLGEVRYSGNENDALLLEMIALDERSFSEAGMRFGLTERTVRYRYSKLLRRCRDIFSRKGIRGMEDLL